MAWKSILKPNQFRNSPTVCFRVRQDNGRPRVYLRVGAAAMSAMKWKPGQCVELLWDEAKCRLGLRAVSAGRKLTGHHKSGEVSFPFPGGVIGKAIIDVDGKELDPVVDGDVLVLELRKVAQ